MSKIKGKIEIQLNKCEEEGHENIDVNCNFLGCDESWKDRVCKKCCIPERLQKNKEFIQHIKDVKRYISRMFPNGFKDNPNE